MKCLKESLLDDEEDLIENSDITRIVYWFSKNSVDDKKKQINTQDWIPCISMNKNRTINLDLTSLTGNIFINVDLLLPDFIVIEEVKLRRDQKLTFSYNGINVNLKGFPQICWDGYLIINANKKIKTMEFPSSLKAQVSDLIINVKKGCDSLIFARDMTCVSLTINGDVTFLYNFPRDSFIEMNKQTVINLLKDNGILSWSANLTIK